MMKRRHQFDLFRRTLALAVAGLGWLIPFAGQAQLTYSPGPVFTQSLDLSQTRIQITPALRHKLFAQSDAITIATTGNTTIRVMKLDGTVIYTGAPTTLSGLATGHYVVETSGDRASFLVLPNDYAGSAFLELEATTYHYMLESYNRLQPAWLRTFEEGYWSTVQPTATTWNWAPLDGIVAANPGRKIVVQAFLRPSWQTDDNQFIAKFTNYVQQVAARYGSQLYGFEIWNEPYDLGSASSKLPTPWQTSYATMVAQSAAVIRAVNPNLKVIGLNFVNYTDYVSAFQTFATNGTIQTLDAVAYHDYDTDRFRPDQDTPYGNTVTPRLDKKIATIRSLIGPTKAIFVNEIGLNGQSSLGIPNATGYTGVTSSPAIDWRRGMARAIKYAVMYGAGGVQQMLPHTMAAACWGTVPGDNIEIYGMEYADRGPHPKTSGFLMAGYWLNNATVVDWRTLGDRVFLYAIRRPNNTSLVFAWTIEGNTVALKANHGLTIKDMFGNAVAITALGEQPVLITSTSSDTAGLLTSVINALNENINNPPVLSPVSNQSVQYNQLLQFTVAAVDPDHEPVTYSATPLPAGATLDPVTGAFSWTPTTAQAGSYTLTLTATDVRGNSASTQTTITVLGNLLDGLVNHWKFDHTSGTTAADSAGTNPGTLANFGFTTGSGWTTGHANQALAFDGVNDYVALDSAKVNFTNNFTLAVWINPQNAAGTGAFFSGRSNYQTSGLRMWVDVNRLLIQGQTTAGWQSASFAPGAIQNGAWQHVVVVYDKSTLKVYLNGVSQGSANWGGNLVMNASAPSRIGSEQGYHFRGILDEVMIFNRTLSPSEVTALYQGASQPPVLAPIGAKSVLAGQLLTFTISATDADGDPLTYSASGLPSGATFNAGTRTFSWTSTSAQAGNHNVTFAVSDGNQTDSETVAITVSTVNQPPVLAAIGSKSVNEGATLTFTVSATDADGDPLTYAAANLPAGASFSPTTRTFSWSPSFTQAGSYTVTFTVADNAATDSEAVTITVADVNRAPVLASIGNKSVNENSTLSFMISATDPDGNSLAYSASVLPSGASFNTSTRTFSWTPTYTQAGNYSVTFSVTDGSLSASETITIAVANVNRAPTLTSPGNKSVNENSNLSFTVSGSDPDGDPVTYSATGLPSGASFNASTRTFAWTPSYSQAGNYSVTFTVGDGSLSASQSITITVVNVNRAPTLTAIGNKTVNTGQALSFTISGSDPDADPLTYSASPLPTGATFNASTRTFGWTPTSAQAGSYTVTFTVSDGSLSASETITITVGTVNQPPVLAAIGNKSVNENSALSFTVTATDPETNPLTYTTGTLPSGATFNASTRTFSWTPGYSQAGSYSVAFTVSDGSLTDSETITITVADVNRAPVLAAIGNKSVNENSVLSFTISATDPDGNSLAYSASGLPSGASFNTSTRTFSWTPTYAQAGNYSVTFSVTDGSLSASETITIAVTNVNRAPVLAPIGAQSTTTGQSLVFTVSGSDPDGDALSFSAAPLPASGTFDGSTRTFSWTPAASQTGTVSVVFSVADGALTTTESVAITVSSATANTAPTLDSIALVAGVAGSPVTYTLVGHDLDGDPLTYSATGLPSGAVLGAGSGALTWTPAITQVGSFNALAIVSDGRATASQEMPILVVHPNYDWLAGGKLFAYQVLNNNRIFVYAFRRPDRALVIAWCKPGTTATLAATPTLSRTDLYNQPSSTTTLGSQPILFHSGKRVSPRQSLDAVVAAIQF